MCWRVRGAHVSVRLLGIVIGVGVPEAPASHAHALPPLLAHHHLHDKLVPRQLQLRLELVLDLVGDLARPLRRQLRIVPEKYTRGRVVRRAAWAARALECEQRAGDLLFVPSNWGHAVLNLETSVGLAIEVIPL